MHSCASLPRASAHPRCVAFRPLPALLLPFEPETAFLGVSKETDAATEHQYPDTTRHKVVPADAPTHM